MPALHDVISAGNDIEIIGVSRRQPDVLELVGEGLIDRTKIFTMSLDEPSEYLALRDFVNLSRGEQVLIYLSVPPGASADIVDFLGQAGFNTPNVKLLFEKPFGFEYESAKDFLGRTAKYFSEKQIFRIDHYAAKEIAKRLIELRYSAEGHHRKWSSQSIRSVEILATETIGIEGRAGFYEQTGALRDFVQGHLMQLLSLVLMDIPDGVTSSEIPKYRARAMNEIVPANPDLSVRAQYEGYETEVNNPGSEVETFVTLHLTSENPNWHDTDVILTTGKAMDVKRSQIVITYRDGVKEIFDETEVLPIDGSRKLDAYERVLIDAIQGNKMVFTSGEEVLRSWQILAPLQEAWNMNLIPLRTYRQGSKIDTVLE